MINELDLLWLLNFIALGIYFIFETKFSWNEGIDTCFNVDCVLLGRTFDFLGGYKVVNARYLMVSVSYCTLLGGYCSFLVVIARYRSLLLVPTFSMNVTRIENSILSNTFYMSINIFDFMVEILFISKKIMNKQSKLINHYLMQ